MTLIDGLVIKTSQQSYLKASHEYALLKSLNFISSITPKEVALGNKYVEYTDVWQANSSLNPGANSDYDPYATNANKTALDPISNVKIEDYAQNPNHKKSVAEEHYKTDFNISSILTTYSVVLNNQFLSPAMYKAIVNRVREIVDYQMKTIAIQRALYFLVDDGYVASKYSYLTEFTLASSKIDTYTDAELLNFLIELKYLGFKLTKGTTRTLLKGINPGTGSKKWSHNLIYNGSGIKHYVYVDYVLWTQITSRVKATVFNLKELEVAGLTIIPVWFENLTEIYTPFGTKAAAKFKFNKPMALILDEGVYNEFLFFEASKTIDTPKLYQDTYFYRQQGQFRNKARFMGVIGAKK